MMASIRRLLREDREARDVLQEAFLVAFKAIGTPDARQPLTPWLHRIALDATLRRLRQRVADDSIDALLPTFLEDGHHARHPHEWEAPLATRPETWRFVRAAIDRLPEAFRVVLLLCDVEAWSTVEVAQALGLTDNLVRVRLHRARQALRGLLESRFEREH